MPDISTATKALENSTAAEQRARAVLETAEEQYNADTITQAAFAEQYRSWLGKSIERAHAERELAAAHAERELAAAHAEMAVLR